MATMTRLIPVRASTLILIGCVALFSGMPHAASRTVSDATPVAPDSLPSLDADCIRFLDPTAVVNDEIVYTSFSEYDAALTHAVRAWSPERGFGIPFREEPPDGETVPAGTTLIVRDASVPSTPFKGVTVTWTHAPATITLNQATLPPPGATDEALATTQLAVMTHEFGHALGLGDVPPPGVTIRECATMLMKRSVDRGGGPMTAPQPGDIALYCMRWGGEICGGDRAANTIPGADSTPEPMPSTSQDAAATPRTSYFFSVVACETQPNTGITSEELTANTLPDGCARAPAGVLFNVAIDGGSGYSMLTSGQGEFAVFLPEDGSASISLPQSGEDLFPSLVGFRPVISELTISTNDPACDAPPSSVCHAAFVLVSST